MMVRLMIRAGVALVVLTLGLVATLGAQGEAPEAFQPLKPGELAQEQLPAAPLVFGAYAFVWLALLIYVLFLWRRLAQVDRDLADVNARLEAKRR
jgi:CcmD family protein